MLALEVAGTGVDPVGRIACFLADLKGDSNELKSHKAGPELPPSILYMLAR